MSSRRVRTPTALSLRPPSFSASFRSARPARSAGIAPARMPVRIDAASANSSTRAVDRHLFGARQLAGEQRRAGARAPMRASSSPAAPPATASTSASTSSCWNTRPRPAPSAERIAISLRRASARANSRLPTLAQAISRTSATAREQHHQRHPDVADDHFVQRDHRRAPAGVVLRDTRLRAASRSRSISALRLLRRRHPACSRAIDLRVVVLADRALLVGVRQRHPQVAARWRPTLRPRSRAGITPTTV